MPDDPTGSEPGTKPGTPGAPIDAGKTSGGGSSGHDQPADVTRQTKIRNQGQQRGRVGAQRDPPDPIPELEP